MSLGGAVVHLREALLARGAVTNPITRPLTDWPFAECYRGSHGTFSSNQSRSPRSVSGCVTSLHRRRSPPSRNRKWIRCGSQRAQGADTSSQRGSDASSSQISNRHLPSTLAPIYDRHARNNGSTSLSAMNVLTLAGGRSVRSPDEGLRGTPTTGRPPT